MARVPQLIPPAVAARPAELVRDEALLSELMPGLNAFAPFGHLVDLEEQGGKSLEAGRPGNLIGQGL